MGGGFSTAAETVFSGKSSTDLTALRGTQDPVKQSLQQSNSLACLWNVAFCASWKEKLKNSEKLGVFEAHRLLRKHGTMTIHTGEAKEKGVGVSV